MQVQKLPKDEGRLQVNFSVFLISFFLVCVKILTSPCECLNQEFLKHGLSCKIKEKGCPVCKRVFNLLNLHARSCRVEGCTVPDCNRIKEHMRYAKNRRRLKPTVIIYYHRKNAIRQQQMDDRRRQMMNEMYRGGASTNSSEG